MGIVIGLLRTARVSMGLVAVGAVEVGMFATRVGVPAPRQALLCMTVLLLSAFGFMLNDCVDARRDSENKPARPIPSGIVNRRVALCVGAACGCFSLACSLGVSESTGILTAILLVLLGAYSFLKARLLLPTILITPAASASPFIYAWIATGSGRVAGFAVLAFFLVLGRETIKDLQDAGPDRRHGIKTIPVLYGSKMALTFAGATFTLGLGTLLVLHFLNPRGIYGTWSTALAATSFVLGIVVALFLMVRGGSENAVRISLHVTHGALPMALVGVLLDRVL